MSSMGSLGGLVVKNPPTNVETQETWVRSLGQEDHLEKEMATHFSILAWKIPWTEEPGRLQSMGSRKVNHDSEHVCTMSSTHCILEFYLILTIAPWNSSVLISMWQVRILRHSNEGTIQGHMLMNVSQEYEPISAWFQSSQSSLHPVSPTQKGSFMPDPWLIGPSGSSCLLRCLTHLCPYTWCKPQPQTSVWGCSFI